MNHFLGSPPLIHWKTLLENDFRNLQIKCCCSDVLFIYAHWCATETYLVLIAKTLMGWQDYCYQLHCFRKRLYLCTYTKQLCHVFKWQRVFMYLLKCSAQSRGGSNTFNLLGIPNTFKYLYLTSNTKYFQSICIWPQILNTQSCQILLVPRKNSA